jgi:NAD(P)-dependent dehydrogenase (short-subunit alcohol dehydrogenase family)
VVTGGGRGIGAATSSLLAAQGWDVVVAYRADAAAAEGVAARCGGLAVRCDVAEERDVVALFAAADERGTLGALVSNAGIVAPRSRVDAMDAERVTRLFAVNVVGTFRCAREAVRRMSTAYGGAGGAIVAVSSVAARLGSPGEYVDYAATKGAVDTMTVGLAREVAREGVRVNAVRPGLVDTGIHASGGQPDRAERLAPEIPMGRAGTADEVAEAVAWLCSDAASYVTGALLDVSGGR